MHVLGVVWVFKLKGKHREVKYSCEALSRRKKKVWQTKISLTGTELVLI